MKILWITNNLLPEAQSLLMSKKGEMKSSGGWLLGAISSIISYPDIELYIATVSSLAIQLEKLKGEKITYYVIPIGRGNKQYNKEYESFWKHINNDVQPDVVHIHGTEFSHGLAFVNACGSSKVVVSIQGLVSVCSRYYYTGISISDIYRNLTLHDIIKGTIISDQRKFEKRGAMEKDLLTKVSHVIGRTSWDKAHVWTINPSATYHFCNESLRPEFYNGRKWNYNKCIKHRIFLSQAYYPIKGFHQLVKALPLIIRHYPDTHVRIAGEDILHPTILHYQGVIKWINKIIQQNKLNDRIVFTGPLNAEGMIDEYMNANVFLCPSSIENSPNSLGEAQILGVPVVASYVGGIPDMMKGDEEHLYRFDEIEMMAQKICDVFSAEDNHIDMREVAMTRHNIERNGKQLYGIYKKIFHS